MRHHGKNLEKIKHNTPSNLITELSQISYGKDLEKFPLTDTRHLNNKKRIIYKSGNLYSLNKNVVHQQNTKKA